MFAVFLRMKVLHLFLALLIVAEGIPVAYAGAQDTGSSVDNVRFEVAGDIVRIYYDLNAPLDQVHAVRIVLFRETEPTFKYNPVNLTGDVGTIVFPGARRRIIWEFTKEFAEGLNGTDYYFVVEAEATQKESTDLWWWVGGGAAVAVGLVTVLLLGPKTEPPPVPVSNEFPAPPGRPPTLMSHPKMRKDRTHMRILIGLCGLAILAAGMALAQKISGRSPSGALNVAAQVDSGSTPTTLRVRNVSFDTEFSEPSGNNALDPKETGRLRVVLTNSGKISLRNVVVRVIPLATPVGVTYNDSIAVGDIPVNATRYAIFYFSASSNVPSQILTFQIDIHDSLGRGSGFPPGDISDAGASRWGVGPRGGYSNAPDSCSIHPVVMRRIA